MAIFVSQSQFEQTGVAASVDTPSAHRKTVRVVALLTLSLTAHVVAAETLEAAVRPDARPPQPPMQDVRGNSGQGFNLPHWSQQQPLTKDIIPPPPPGPYSSSALSDYSVAVPSPAYRPAKPVPRYPSNNNPTSAPMATFSPDIPWPTNLRPEQAMPNHRLSGQGSYPAPPSYGSAYGPGINNNYGNYNYANRPNPYVNDMGMNASRWMPNMEMPVPGPYNNRRNYAPNYGSYYGPGYGRPVINNNSTGSTNPAYR